MHTVYHGSGFVTPGRTVVALSHLVTLLRTVVTPGHTFTDGCHTRSHYYGRLSHQVTLLRTVVTLSHHGVGASHHGESIDRAAVVFIWIFTPSHATRRRRHSANSTTANFQYNVVLNLFHLFNTVVQVLHLFNTVQVQG